MPSKREGEVYTGGEDSALAATFFSAVARRGATPADADDVRAFPFDRRYRISPEVGPLPGSRRRGPALHRLPRQ